MFFKKKKPTPQAEAAPSAAKETVNKPAYPYHEALDWTVERMALKEKQAKAGWTAAKIMGIWHSTPYLVSRIKQQSAGLRSIGSQNGLPAFPQGEAYH